MNTRRFTGEYATREEAIKRLAELLAYEHRAA